MTSNAVSKLGLMVFVSAFALIFAASSFAQQMQEGQQSQGRIGDQPGAGGFMERFDADKDGKVTKEEFPGPEDMFGQLDKNEDGAITEDEVPTGPPGQ